MLSFELVIAYGRPGYFTAPGPHTALWLTLTGPCKVNWELQNKHIFYVNK